MKRKLLVFAVLALLIGCGKNNNASSGDSSQAGSLDTVSNGGSDINSNGSDILGENLVATYTAGTAIGALANGSSFEPREHPSANISTSQVMTNQKESSTEQTWPFTARTIANSSGFEALGYIKFNNKSNFKNISFRLAKFNNDAEDDYADAKLLLETSENGSAWTERSFVLLASLLPSADTNNFKGYTIDLSANCYFRFSWAVTSGGSSNNTRFIMKDLAYNLNA